MTWRAPTPKFPRVRCTACGREELDEGATCRNFRQVRTEGNRQVARELPFYNLPGRIRETWRCQCGHAFTRDARVHHDHRDVQMEASP